VRANASSSRSAKESQTSFIWRAACWPHVGVIPFFSGSFWGAAFLCLSVALDLINLPVGSCAPECGVLPLPSMNLSRASLLLAVTVAIPFTSAVALRADLPKAGFPLGRADLIETRTVKELRPGLTHVRVERGSWPSEGPPKWAIVSSPLIDEGVRVSVRRCLESAGLTVEEHVLGPSLHDAPMLLAREFDSQEDARAVLSQLSCASLLHVSHPAALLTWDGGPWALDIVIVDPRRYHGKVVMDRGLGRVRPSELARERGAVVAMNANFFEYSRDGIDGVPSGIAILQGEWHNEHYPEVERAPIVVIDNDAGGALSISNEAPPFPVLTYAGGKTVRLAGVDRVPHGDEIVAIRQDVWGYSFLSHGAPEHLLAVQLGKYGEPYRVNRGVPTSGLFLLASGEGKTILEEALVSGEPVEVDLRVPGRPGLNMLYGAPVLIRDGQPVAVPGIGSDTPPDAAYGIYRARYRRTGRTAIGADAEGKIYLITVYTDGLYNADAQGRPGSGIGASIGELRAVAQFLGLENAMNLDGGGSTSMTIEGRVAQGVIDVQLSHGQGRERPVSVSILVIDNE